MNIFPRATLQLGSGMRFVKKKAEVVWRGPGGAARRYHPRLRAYVRYLRAAQASWMRVQAFFNISSDVA